MSEAEKEFQYEHVLLRLSSKGLSDAIANADIDELIEDVKQFFIPIGEIDSPGDIDEDICNAHQNKQGEALKQLIPIFGETNVRVLINAMGFMGETENKTFEDVFSLVSLHVGVIIKRVSFKKETIEIIKEQE